MECEVNTLLLLFVEAELYMQPPGTPLFASTLNVNLQPHAHVSEHFSPEQLRDAFHERRELDFVVSPKTPTSEEPPEEAPPEPVAATAPAGAPPTFATFDAASKHAKANGTMRNNGAHTSTKTGAIKTYMVCCRKPVRVKGFPLATGGCHAEAHILQADPNVLSWTVITKEEHAEDCDCAGKTHGVCKEDRRKITEKHSKPSEAQTDRTLPIPDLEKLRAIYRYDAGRAAMLLDAPEAEIRQRLIDELRLDTESQSMPGSKRSLFEVHNGKTAPPRKRLCLSRRRHCSRAPSTMT